MDRKNKTKLRRKERRAKRRVTLRTLFLLSITLIINTYAWFLYITTVSGNITAHVDAWRVSFEVDNEEVEEEFNFEIQHIYPGMADKSKTVAISNTGDKQADIGYEIKYVKIFDEEYATSEAVAEGIPVSQNATILSSEAIANKIQNDYPFKLIFDIDGETISPEETSEMTITFRWQYDQGDDETDTMYGTQAYSYTNGTSIKIKIKIKAEQHKEE